MATNQNKHTNRQYDDDDELTECPLCLEALDIDDANFYPCGCGYQICRFCWHRIRTDENGLCPQCRKPYEEDPAAFKPVSEEEMVKIKGRKRGKKAATETSGTTASGSAIPSAANGTGSGSERERGKKRPAVESRKAFADLRVVQRNLVFVVGLSNRLANVDMLKRHELFGQFGKILKVVVSHNTTYAGSQPSASAYITYQRGEDAMRAIFEVNGKTTSVALPSDAHKLRCSLGTTKYCSQFLKGAACTKPDCMYLHEVGDPLASFTKENMQQGMHTRYEHDLLEAFKRSLAISPKNSPLNDSSSDLQSQSQSQSQSADPPNIRSNSMSSVNQSLSQLAEGDQAPISRARGNSQTQSSASASATKAKNKAAKAAGAAIAPADSDSVAASGHRRTHSSGQKMVTTSRSAHSSAMDGAAAGTGTGTGTGSASSIPLQVGTDGEAENDGESDVAPSGLSQSPGTSSATKSEAAHAVDSQALMNGSRDESVADLLAAQYPYLSASASASASVMQQQHEAVEREAFAADPRWMRPESDQETQQQQQQQSINMAFAYAARGRVTSGSGWPCRNPSDSVAQAAAAADGVLFGVGDYLSSMPAASPADRPNSFYSQPSQGQSQSQNHSSPATSTNAIVQQLLAGTAVSRQTVDQTNGPSYLNSHARSETLPSAYNGDYASSGVSSGGGVSLLQAIINSSRNASAGARHLSQSQPQSQLAAFWQNTASGPSSGPGPCQYDSRSSLGAAAAAAWGRLPAPLQNSSSSNNNNNSTTTPMFDAAMFEYGPDAGRNGVGLGDSELQRRAAMWNAQSVSVSANEFAYASAFLNSDKQNARMFETGAPDNTSQPGRFGGFSPAFTNANGWN